MRQLEKLSLFWKKFTFAGAAAGIVVGAAVDALWLGFLSGTGIYEIIPGAICGLVAAVAVSKATYREDPAIEALFDKAISYEEK